MVLQCWCGAHGGVHHAVPGAGAHAVRGRGGHVPDREDVAHPAARHGTDGGEGITNPLLYMTSKIIN